MSFGSMLSFQIGYEHRRAARDTVVSTLLGLGQLHQVLDVDDRAAALVLAQVGRRIDAGVGRKGEAVRVDRVESFFFNDLRN